MSDDLPPIDGNEPPEEDLSHEQGTAPIEREPGQHDRVEPIDLNTASTRALERLPGVTPSMARRIVEGRPYAAPTDLVERGVLSARELERIADRVTVGERR